MAHNIKNIVWDLSGTLFRPSDIYLTEQQKKHTKLIFLMWAGHKVPSEVEQYALDILYKLGRQRVPKEKIIRLHTGEPVPKLVCSWLEGKISSKQAQEQAIEGYYKNISKFNLPIETEQLVKTMLELFFDPVLLSDCMAPIPESLALVRYCFEKKFEQYVLSNWDTESFNILYKSKNGQEVFQYFKPDNIVISADIGALKPRPRIFIYFFQKYNLDPKSCLFIDDQQENIEAAKKYGMNGILYNLKNIDLIKQFLNESGNN